MVTWIVHTRRHTRHADDCTECTETGDTGSDQWEIERLTGSRTHLAAAVKLTCSWRWSCRQGGHGSMV